VRDIGVGKIVGLSGEGWWAQVHDFAPEEEDKLKMHRIYEEFRI